MRLIAMVSLCLSGALVTTAALAAAGSVTILAPADGATLDAMEQNKVEYEVVPGPRGDHLHVYIDGSETGLLRQLKGTYTLETLAPGAHEICIKVVNKNHTPTGPEQCIHVTVE
ncbi:MAG: hypothetical protein WCY26_02045 [Thiohalobacteraceae bacterium]|nr:hypothetical protein [Gammaproteobacteria bacterium]